MKRRPIRAVAGRCLLAVALCCALPPWKVSSADTLAAAGRVDPRVHTVAYSPNEVYRLPGYIGYQIELQFAPGERFLGLGAGDIDGLAFEALDNHLFIKPKAAHVRTNITVLTSRHAYRFDYVVSQRPPDPLGRNVIYLLRFTYAAKRISGIAAGIGLKLSRASATRSRNFNYWYGGAAALKPQAAWDDGVETTLRFGSRQELPAVFVRNDDGSESLVNYTVRGNDLVVQRVARRLVVRRGRLSGCIVNESYSGTGESLRSGTVSPTVKRALRVHAP